MTVILAEPIADKLLTRHEAAAILGIAPQTLASWACTGRYGLPFVKIGSLVRYRLSDLNAFIESRSQSGA